MGMRDNDELRVLLTRLYLDYAHVCAIADGMADSIAYTASAEEWAERLRDAGVEA